MSMTLNQIQYFLTIARYENYHKAAQELYVSQPSLSRAIAALEEEMGVVLFEKHGRGVMLTRAGKIFREYAERIVRDCSIAERKMQELSTDGGKVEIGYVFPLAGSYIPRKVRKFLDTKENSQVVFTFWQNHTPAIVNRVLKGTLDIGFGGYVGNDELEYFPLISQEMVVITPKDHPLAGRESVSVRELENYPVIGYDRESWMGTHLRAFYKKYEIKVSNIIECPDEYSVSSLVAEDFGIALVPRTEYIKKADVEVLKLDDIDIRHQIFMFWKKDRYQIPAVEKFLEYMKQQSSGENDNQNSSIMYLKDIFNY